MIKKFLNPSGKLTYEEALRQAGERVESLTRPSILVKGVNNSNRRVPNVRERAKGRARIRNREKEELILRFNLQNEMHALVPSGKHYDPIADEDVTDYENHYSPKIIGMSGADPLMEFYVGGEALGPLFKLLGKGALYTLGRYYRGTNYGDWAAAKLIAPEMNRALVNNSLKLIPSLSQYISLTLQPIKLNESGLTSLKFFERPSKITEAERLGIPKGERNFRPKWHVANYPGYLLKGLMKGSPLEKLLSKLGTININLLNAYFNKASQIERDVANKVLAEKFTGQKTIDYNLFKKAVLDELITYNVSPSQKYSSYGINRLGFDSPDTDLGIQRILLQKYPERFSLIKNGLDVIDRTLGTEYFVDRLYGRGWHSNSKFPQEIRDEYVSLISNSGELYPKISVNLFSSPRIPKGNATHYDINTLGHSRTMVVPGDPKTLYILESQSDWALKSLGLTKAEKAALQHIDEQLKTGTPNGFSTLEELQIQKQAILDRASLRTQGISYQSLHLHDNYLLRQLQENLRYAAENGLTKMRYPTSETAVKIEGYTPLTKKDIPLFSFDDAPLGDTPYSEFISDLEYELKTNPNLSGKEVAKINSLIKRIQKIENRWKAGETTYLPEHETILDKYTEFPKLFLKLYKGQNVRIVTDAKGNTWYEVDVPKGYLNKEWLFKQGGKMNTTLFLKLIHKKGGKLLKAQGGTKFKTTGGAGYVPPTININTEKIKNKIRKNLYDNLYTHSYQSLSDAVLGALGIKSSAVDRIIEGSDELTDANGNYIDFDSYESPMDDAIWATYLSIPKNQRRKKSGELKISKYTPSVGKENNTVYYEFPVSESDKGSIIERGISLPIGKNKITNMDELSASISNIGDYTIGHGYDNKGEYVSVYDKWDLNPFKGIYRKKGLIGNIGNKLFGKKGDLSFGIGKPVNLYNRIYLDDYYKVPDSYRGGTYLPEVVVYPSQELYKRK